MTSKFWGVIDILAVAWFAGYSMSQSRIPFVSDMTDAMNTAISYERALPVVIATLQVALYLSFIISGILLYKHSVIGKRLMYCQLPFRVLFILPSVFFIPKLLSGAATSVVLVSAAVMEIIKVVSIHRSHLKHNE